MAGLMPPYMLGDNALPSSDWRWYYCDNAFSLQGLQRFADADAQLKDLVAFDSDLVVLAIGENVPALDTEDAKAGFKACHYPHFRHPCLLVRQVDQSC